MSDKAPRLLNLRLSGANPALRPKEPIDYVIVFLEGCFQDLGSSSLRSHSNEAAVDVDRLRGHEGGVVTC
jgi:hypothetical protein